MKLQKLLRLCVLALAVMFGGASCVKEGPPGAKGDTGDPGTNGTDANETCKLCHNPTVVDAKSVEFEFSKHKYGEAAFEESGNATCAPCHTQLGFQDVVKNNTLTTFVLNTSTGKYVNSYISSATAAIGELSCFTCHSQLHTTYGYTDFSPLTTTAAVPMTMLGGAKTINLTQDDSKSNLCIKCHQPRPLTNSTDGNVFDYASLKNNPTGIFYDPASSTNKVKPSYRTGIHYGTVGAIMAGMGGVEFTGTMAYANAVHTAQASCSDCHQAAVTGRSGGHTFIAVGNFNGCNTTSCHGTGTVSSSSAKYWTNPRAAIKSLLDQLAAKLKYNGIEILSRNPDSEGNLWYGLTTNNYDGYFNFFDPSSNPNGVANNPGGIFQNPSPSSSWSQADKDFNAALPKLTLTNAQMGAFINFEMCLREYSLGIHNLDYTKALLTNSIAILP
jgi:hypothetical protein